MNKDNLREYIKEIDYNYDYNAAYGFTSKTLRFNVANILEYAKKSFNFYKNSYEPIINISYFNYITRIRTCKTNKDIRNY